MMSCPSPCCPLPSKLGTSPTTTAIPPHNSCMTILMRAYSETGSTMSQSLHDGSPQSSHQRSQSHQLPGWPPAGSRPSQSPPRLQPRVEDDVVPSSLPRTGGVRTNRHHQRRARSLSMDGTQHGPPTMPYYAGLTQGTPRLSRPVAKIQRRSGVRREVDASDNFFLVEE